MCITISEKHGLNPSISICFYCGKEKNELVIPGRLKGDVEAPRKAVWSMEPCDDCKKYMGEGILLIIVRDNSDPKCPYRTGRMLVISDADAVRIFKMDPAKERFAFVEESTITMVFGDIETAKS
ncbi:MAG TPA: hypothetical protein PLZ43_13355 [bacterium]|nr:hypothetical protein [bacterium]